MLNVQRRMHPQIADFSSCHMYNNLLKSAPEMKNNRENIKRLFPLQQSALGLVDLSRMMSVCIKTIDSSRINVLSAFISLLLAVIYGKKAKIGIITPYNAQSRLILSMIRDVEGEDFNDNRINAATVHQFQGSEKDVIIYDVVDCYRMPYPGKLLTSTDHDNANRLFNVALTRAKGKFISVTNIDYMDNKNLSLNLMYSKLLTYLQRNGNRLYGNELISIFRENGTDKLHFYSDVSDTDNFLEDIGQAKKEIRIDVPDQIREDSGFILKFANLLKKAKKKGVKVFLRVENKSTCPKLLLPYAIENRFVANPVTIIDKNVIWFGQPLSEANFISSGKVIKTRFRPLVRFEGEHTAKSLYVFLEMGRTVDQYVGSSDIHNGKINNFASYVLQNKTCPKCKKPMRLIKRKGKFFLGCTNYPNCINTQLVDVDLVDEYLYYLYFNNPVKVRCSRDNELLEAKLGRHGVYVKCNSAFGHTYNLDEI